MKLSEQEELVYEAAVLQASLSVPQLAKQLGMRTHSVRRLIQALFDKGIFLAKRPYVNPSIFGFSEYLLYVSLASGDRAVRKALVKEICEYENVGFVCELGGDFQYELRFLARDSRDLVDFQDVLIARFGPKVSITETVLIHESEYSGTHLSPRPPKVPCLRYQVERQRHQLDELEHQILSLLANGGNESEAEHARRLRVPGATLTYRLRNLERSGIISGYCYMCDVKPLGNLPFCILLEARGFDKKRRQQLLTFCRNHAYVAYVNLTIGSWQAQVYCRAPAYEQVLALSNDLQLALSDSVEEVKILPQLQFFKWSPYPFKSYSLVKQSN